MRGLAERARLCALVLIAEEGSGVVAGYPHVPGEKKGSSPFLDTGTRARCERGGFEFVRPTGLKSTVMRQVVAAAG